MLKLEGNSTMARFEKRSFSRDDIVQISMSKRLKGLVFVDCPLNDDDVNALCSLPQLVNLTIEGSAITDAGVKHLATLPKLVYLFLDRNRITGSGFSSFENNKKIECVSLSNTQLDDAGLQHVARLARLKTLRLDKTEVTFAGILAAADKTSFSIVACDDFPKEQIALFEQRQRDSKKKRPPTVGAAAVEAERALHAFFGAYSDWAKDASSSEEPFGKPSIDAYAAVMRTHCSERKIKEGGPSSVSANTFSGCKIADSEQITKNKLYLFFYDHLGAQLRVLMLRSDTSWKVDAMWWQDGGWKKYYF